MIQADEKPVAQLAVYSLALRDKMDNLQATIEAVDTSYSTDGDDTRTTWYYTFDSDNDGSISDETWSAFGSAQELEALKVDKVGNYYFYNITTDVIPESETISKFLVASDYLSDNSLDQLQAQRNCLVDNVAPVISTTAELDKTVDLLVITDEDGANYTSLVSEVNTLQKELFERKFDLNEQIVNLKSSTLQKSTVGMKKEQTFNWHRYLTMHYDWNWKYQDYPETISSGRFSMKSVIDTLQGTFDDMGGFPTYQNAYATIQHPGFMASSGGTSTWRNGSYIVYNALNDYLATVRQPFFVNVVYNGSSYNSWYTNESKYLNQSGRYYYGDGGGDFTSIFQEPEAPRQSQVVDSDWTQGSLVSEEYVAFDVVLIDQYIELYKDSTNDKYLILAFANGGNLFLPQTLKNKIDQYGFKVYYSLDEYWGEFSPTVPEVVEVEFANNALYAKTKYGNQIKNYSATQVDEVNYQYQQLSDDVVDYNRPDVLNSLSKVGVRTSGLASFRNMNGARLLVSDIQSQTHNSYSGYARNPEGYDRTYYFDSTVVVRNSWYSPLPLKQYTVGSTWNLDDGKSINVVKHYSMGLEIAIVETNTGEFYMVGNDLNESTSDQLSAIKLNINGIDSIYGTTTRSIKHSYGASKNDNYETVNVGHNLLPFEQDIMVMEDLDGKYYLAYMYINDQSGYLVYNPRTDLKFIPLDSLNDFDISFTTANITRQTFNMTYGSSTPYGPNPYQYYYYMTKEWYLDKGQLGYNPAWNMSYPYNVGSRPFDTFGGWSPSVSTWSYVTKDGELYVNGMPVTTGVTATAVHNSADENMVAYIKGGKLYAKGISKYGQLGDFNENTSYETVFNSPYKLSAAYTSQDFACAFDISSQSPAYQIVNRGLYSNITALLLEEYAGYTETETMYVEVGDSITLSALGLDFEGDPIVEKRVDVEHDHTYFDNSNEPFIPPNVFSEDIVIDKAGRMLISLGLKDNPVGNDDRFDNFRYWNKDKTTVEVFAHRKPFAELGYALVPQGSGQFNFVGSDNGSYDLDHSISRADKGIKDRKYYYRKEFEGTWTEFNGTKLLENGVEYQFALRVQDVENTWSDYDIVTIKVEGEPFIMNASLTPSYPTPVPAGSSVVLQADVFTYKAIQSVVAKVDGVNVNLAHQSTNGMERVYSRNYTVPINKRDKDFYDVIFTATATDGTVRIINQKLNVSTPLNLSGNVNPYEIKKGNTGTLTAQTSVYADAVDVDLFDGTANETHLTLTKGTKVGSIQNWSASHIFNENVKEAEYSAVFSATTANGNRESVTDTFKFIPNQPPTVVIESISPGFIYEGDDVVVSCRISDPDLDALALKLEYSKDNGANWIDAYDQVGLTITNESGRVIDIPISSVSKEIYMIRATVTDQVGEVATAQDTFQANELSVSGEVRHVTKWNENRIAFNQSKTGTNESPRPYNVFWPGERFRLEAESTEMDDLATTTCQSVHVEIISKGYSGRLEVDSSQSWKWSGELWDESMLDWKSGTLTFRFTATYSNGVVKSKDVQIEIDNSEDYWQYHRKF